MTPYIGSQDTPRFVTLELPRARRAHDPASRQPVGRTSPRAPPDARAVRATARRAVVAPRAARRAARLLRRRVRRVGRRRSEQPPRRGAATRHALADEQATLALTRKLGHARKSLVALRRGAYVPVFANEPVVVFARVTTDTATSRSSRSTARRRRNRSRPRSRRRSALKDGTTLADCLGGPRRVKSRANRLQCCAAILAP